MLFTPTAAQVKAFGQETPIQNAASQVEELAYSILDPSVVAAIPGSTDRSALIDREARDRQRRKRQVLRYPARASVRRLEDPRASAGVTHGRRRAGNTGKRRHTGRRRRIGPRRTTVLADDDGGHIAAVVTHRHTSCRTRGCIGSAGDRRNVDQWRIAGAGLPTRGNHSGADGGRRDRATDDHAESDHHECSDHKSPDRMHRQLPPARRARQRTVGSYRWTPAD